MITATNCLYHILNSIEKVKEIFDMKEAYRKLDDIPEVFFKETLGGQMFMYNGVGPYASVIDCFNNRKITKNYWLPGCVPIQHKINSKCSGFLTYPGENMVLEVSESGLTEEQFRNRICAELFIKYFEQVYGCSGENGSRYYNAYKACKVLVENLPLTSTRCELKLYTPNWEKGECAVVASVIATSKELAFAEFASEVHISAVSAKAMQNSLFKMFDMVPEDCRIIIHDDVKEPFDDFFWSLVEDSGHKFCKVKEPIDFRKYYTFAIGSVKELEKNFDWDNVYFVR